MSKQHSLLYIKHIVLTRLGTESGAADDGKRACSVAGVVSQAARPLGRGLGRGVSAQIGRGFNGFNSLAGLYLHFSQFS